MPETLIVCFALGALGGGFAGRLPLSGAAALILTIVPMAGMALIELWC